MRNTHAEKDIKKIIRPLTWTLFIALVLLVVITRFDLKPMVPLPMMSQNGPSVELIGYPSDTDMKWRLKDTWWPSLGYEPWNFTGLYNSIREFVDEKHHFPFHLVRNDSIMHPFNDFEQAMSASIEGDPLNPLPSCRTPCWYGRPGTPVRSGDSPVPGVIPRWNKTFHTSHVDRSPLTITPGPRGSQLYCQPAVFLAGQFKSGTTTLWKKIEIHPDIDGGSVKEPDFYRDIIKNSKIQLRSFTRTLQEELRNPKFGKPWVRNVLTMHGKPGLGWWPESDVIERIPGNKGLSQPLYIRPLRMLALNPRAKFIFILRNPTERTYSHTCHFMPKRTRPSEDFHSRVIRQIGKLKGEVKMMGVRHFFLSQNAFLHQTLAASMYYGFLRNWVEIVPRDQLMVIQAERFYREPLNVLQRVAKFLEIEPYPEDNLAIMALLRKKSSRSKIRDSKEFECGVMLNKTRRALDIFFKPFNVMLAEMLQDKDFLWNS